MRRMFAFFGSIFLMALVFGTIIVALLPVLLALKYGWIAIIGMALIGYGLKK